MKIVIDTKTPRSHRLILREQYEVTETLPKVIVAFWNGVKQKGGAKQVLTVQQARDLIRQNKGVGAFYLGNVGNGQKIRGKEVIRPLGMRVIGEWKGSDFRCDQLFIDNNFYSEAIGSGGAKLRSKQTAKDIVDTFPLKVVIVIPPMSTEPWESTKVSAPVFPLGQFFLGMGLSFLTAFASKTAQFSRYFGSYFSGILKLTSGKFLAEIVGGSTLMASLAVMFLRNFIKKNAYEIYTRKNSEALSLVAEGERVAFSSGFEAGKGYLKYFQSFVSPSAYRHPNAYYAGLVAGELNDEGLKDRVSPALIR
ncbi:MAG TPA: hypothetical protein VJ205_04585 [Gammaproteobacteria bacterium]|nr:hypothetical protein [Gammaproteobacteria bacterium]